MSLPPRADRALALCRVGRVGLALEAASLKEIRALEPAELEGRVQGGAPWVDVAEALGMPAPAGRRHLLEFSSDALGGGKLLVGDWVSLQAVAPQSIRTWPPFLAGLSRPGALEGYLEREDQNFYVIQLAALLGPRSASEERGD